MTLRRSLALWLLLLTLPAVALAAPPRPLIGTATFQYIKPARTSVSMARVDRDGPQPKQPPLVPVPQVRQHSKASCGLGIAQMLCGYYKPEMPRGAALTRQARGYTYREGLPTPGLRQLLGKLGFEVTTKTNMSLAELVGHVNRGDPVGVGAQAWASRPVDWRTDTVDGHYMLVVGFGDRKGKPLTSVSQVRRTMKQDPDNAIIWLADPAMSTGRRGWMPVAEFLQRWHWPGEKQLGIVAHPKHDTGARAQAFIPSTQRIR